MKKLYSISELINENIKLKKQLEKKEVETLKAIIGLLRISKGMKEEERIKILNGFETELEKLI